MSLYLWITTVYRPYFDEEEDMATAKQLLQSINRRRATVRPAVKEDEVRRILGVYGASEESSVLTTEGEMDAFLEMYSSNKDTSSQPVIVSDSFNPDDQGYSPRRMDDERMDVDPSHGLTTETTSSTPRKTVVTVSTQTPPMDIVSATISHPTADTTDDDSKPRDLVVFSPSTSTSPRYHQTTTHIIEHQHHRQQHQQRQQQHQQHPIFKESNSSSSAIGIQDIIDVKNEIASTKLELSTATNNINYRRTPTIIRLETKIERLETLLIEYLRMERMETSMMEHLHNKHHENNQGIQNRTVSESGTPSSLLSHQNHYHHSVGPHSIGSSSIISSEKSPSKSMWLTHQRPTSTRHDPYQQTDEQPLPLEDLWDLLDLAEQLSCQN